jgi:cytochrome c heme-lyase
MFYNALARKHKLDDDTSEADMESVVAVHNHMNEQTWEQILRYERTVLLGRSDPPEAETTASSSTKLLKFHGRPQDLSPKAALKHYLCGHPLPFDRHDWFIERSNGQVVRYVLDYYAGIDHSLHVDVRPALDGPISLYERAVVLPLARLRDTTDFIPLPLFPNDVLKAQYDESKHIWQNLIHGGGTTVAGGSTAAAVSSSLPTITVADLLKNDCRAVAASVSACTDEADCQRASIDLTLCLGKRLCLAEYADLQRSAANSTTDGFGDDNVSIETTLRRLQACVDQQPK